jgi:transposase
MEVDGTFFPSLMEDLRIDQITVTAATLCVYLVSTQATSRCPLCDQVSTQIHSRYRRTVADVPCGSQPVRLLLDVRKFFCRTKLAPIQWLFRNFDTVGEPP